MIIRDREGGGEGRHETVAQNRQIVVVDIKILKNGLDIGLQSGRFDYVFQSEDAFLVHDGLLSLGFALKVFGSIILPNGHGNQRIYARSVDIFLCKREILPKAFLEIRIEILYGERHLAIRLRFVLRSGSDIARILVCNYVLDEFHGRIAFSLIFLLALLWGNNHILQAIHIRLQPNGLPALDLALTKLHLKRLVAHHLEAYCGVVIAGMQTEMPIHIGGGARTRRYKSLARGFHKRNLHKRERIARLRINRDARNAGGVIEVLPADCHSCEQ